MVIDAGKVVAMLELDTSNFSSGLGSARQLLNTWQSETTTLADKLKNTGSAISGIGKVMSTAVTLPLAAMGTAAVRTFMSFDDSMRQVRATMNASEEDVEKLTAAAKEMGSTTRYSASESANALNYLALAGYNADQAIEALPTVLRLAQAGGIDLAYASDMVTDSMSALGLEMDELDGFVDQMAVTAQKANTSVGQLGESILTVGGTAKSLAGGTVELNAELGILADNGIKGAEGGTHLRNVILSLQNPTDEGAKALVKYTSGVYDAEGHMRSLDDILGELNDSLSEMTDAERQNVISGIFNKTDLAAVEALLAGTGERYAELTGYISESAGAAAVMAETMEGGIGGAFRSLGSAVEGLAINFGERLAPTVQSVAEFVTGLTNQFASLPVGMQETIVKVGAFVAAAGPVLMIGGKIITMFGSMATVMSGPAGWITLGIAGIALLVGALNRLSQQKVKLGISAEEIENYKLDDIDLGEQNAQIALNIENKGKTAYEQIVSILNDGLPETEEDQAAMVASVNAVIDEAMEAVEKNYQTKKESLDSLLAAGVIDEKEYNARVTRLQNNTQETKDALQGDAQEVTDYVAALVAANAPMTEEQIAYLQELIDKLTETSTAAAVAADAAMSGYKMAYEREVGGYGVEGDTEKAATYIETTYRQKMSDAEKQMAADEADYATQLAQYAEGTDEYYAVLEASEQRAEEWKQVKEQIAAERTAMYADLAGSAVESQDGLGDLMTEYFRLTQELESLEVANMTATENIYGKTAYSDQIAEKKAEIEQIQSQIDQMDTTKLKDVMGYMYANDESADATQIETLNGLINGTILLAGDLSDKTQTAADDSREAIEQMGPFLENAAADGQDGWVATVGEYGPELYQSQYENGANSVQGSIDGMESKRGALIAEIVSLDSLISSVTQRDLGIHSPSTVMRKLGGFVSQGFALGIADNETLVRHATEHMAGSAANVPTGAGQQASAAGKRGNGVTLNINGAVIRNEDDARNLARQLGGYVAAMNYGV